jgi:hypothetical protein
MNTFKNRYDLGTGNNLASDGSRINPSTSDGARALCLVGRPPAWALKLPGSLRFRPNLSSANQRNGQIASYFQGVAGVIF